MLHSWLQCLFQPKIGHSHSNCQIPEIFEILGGSPHEFGRNINYSCRMNGCLYDLSQARVLPPSHMTVYEWAFTINFNNLTFYSIFFTENVSKSSQISLLSHIMYTSVLMVKFLGTTRLCAMAVQVTKYEKCTIYINNNIHTIHICTIYNCTQYTVHTFP